jgi:hypothetical protein
VAVCEAADVAGCCVSPPEQLSAPTTLYIGFRKATLKKTWDSASLRTETLRVMLMQFLDTAAVVYLQVYGPNFKEEHGAVQF